MQRIILHIALGMLTTGTIGCEIRHTSSLDHQSTQGKVTMPTEIDTRTEITLLYPRIGTWDVVIRTEPTKTSPRGGFDKGVAKITKGPGGFSVVQESWSRGTSGYVLGQSYTWWDNSAKSYKSVWCDNMLGCTEFITIVSGKRWAVELDSDTSGKKVHTVIRAAMSDNLNAIHEEVTSSYDGGQAKLESVSEYVRRADNASRE